MKFETISHINDVINIVTNDENKSFVLIEKDDVHIIDYVVAFGDTFPNILTREDSLRHELRGITFDLKTGSILSRPFHKFFNVNEKDDTREDIIIEKVMNGSPYVILDKLDGSMIHTYVKDGNVIFNTRKGVTDVAKMAEGFVMRNCNYRDDIINFCKKCFEMNLTPIFEYCGVGNQVVIEYSEESMTLIGIRSIMSGEYVFGLKKFVKSLGDYNFPIVKDNLHLSLNNFETFKNDTYQKEDIEGFVITFDDGFRAKIKSDWYMTLHRTISSVDRFNDVVPMILDGRIDDLLPRLSGYKLDYVKYLINDVEKIFNHMVDNITLIWKTNNNLLDISRKEYALEVIKNKTIFRPILFGMADDRDTINNIKHDYMLREYIEEKCRDYLIDNSNKSTANYVSLLNSIDDNHQIENFVYKMQLMG